MSMYSLDDDLMTPPQIPSITAYGMVIWTPNSDHLLVVTKGLCHGALRTS
jgi:hypothetical protein